MINDWQSRNYEGIESPLAYTIRKGKWTDRPIWTQYTTWWTDVSIVAGFNVGHPFLWYLLLWTLDPGNVSKKNVFILSGSATGILFAVSVLTSDIIVGCEFLGGNISLGNVSGISMLSCLALEPIVAYSNPTSYSVDISGVLTNYRMDTLGMFCDSNQNTYGLCFGGDVYGLSLS